MSEEKVLQVMTKISKLVPQKNLALVRQKLMDVSDDRFITIFSCVTYKNPGVSLVLSLFLGTMGIDRFYLAEYGLGVLKFLTLGGCLLWWLIDLFIIIPRTKEKNYQELMQLL